MATRYLTYPYLEEIFMSTKKIENIGAVALVDALRIMNPTGKFALDSTFEPTYVIYGNVPADQLKFPEGYYHNAKNGITNKHSTNSGMYEGFDYHFKPERFKKSIFERIFG